MIIHGGKPTRCCDRQQEGSPHRHDLRRCRTRRFRRDRNSGCRLREHLLSGDSVGDLERLCKIKCDYAYLRQRGQGKASNRFLPRFFFNPYCPYFAKYRSSTCLAIGAATAPPEPDSSASTRIATFGLSAGRNRQTRNVSPYLPQTPAEPVFPATV